MSKTIELKVPTGWSDDKLSQFFDLAQRNAFASFVQLPETYAKLTDVDAALLLIGENLHHPQIRGVSV